MKTNYKKSSAITAACLGTALFATNANAAMTVLNPVSDGTYFQVAASTDERVNVDVGRAGSNGALSFDFVGLLVFDVTSLASINVSDITNITLTYSLGAQDNTPALDDIRIDYIGTFASSDLGSNGANGASATAIAMGAATSVENYFNGAATAGNNKTLDVTTLKNQTFVNTFAAFRLSDPSQAAHQWDIGDTTGTGGGGTAIPAASITITTVPEPSSTALLGLGGLALILRRRK